MNHRLLPPNASEFERAMEDTLTRLHAIEVPIDTLWNPRACPEVLLPWLAWAVSVDYWESRWTVEQKRQAIADSLFVHQQKGTLASIERVLNNLNITAVVEEWFDTGGPPHTFELTAWVNDNLHGGVGQGTLPIFNTQLYSALKTAVDTTKPVRSHYTFRVGVQFNHTLQLSTASFVANLTRIVMAPVDQQHVTAHSNIVSTTNVRLINLVRVNLIAE